MKRVHPVHRSSMEGPCCSEGWWKEIREGLQVEGAWLRGCGKVPKTKSRVYWHCLSSWARCACDNIHTHTRVRAHTHTHTHKYMQNQSLRILATGMHTPPQQDKTHIPLASLANRHTINVLPPECVQRNRHSFGGVLAHVWNLPLLTRASRPNPPGAADIPGSCSDSLPGLQLHPLHPASTWQPHCSHLDPSPCRKFPWPLAASSIKNGAWHSKPYKIWPLLASWLSPHLPIHHFSPFMHCLSSISLQPNPLQCHIT